jgi:hypothetical protein
MNRINYFLSLTAIILLSGCSSDDVADLIGNWNLYQFKVDCPVDGEFYDFKADNGCYSFDGEEACFFLNFREDGSGTITTSFDGESDSSEITYTQTDNQVSVCYAPSECEIFQLNDGKLIYDTVEEGCNSSYVFSK